MTARQALGQHLRAWRKDQGRSAADVARSIGCTPAYLTAVERGIERKQIDESFLHRISGALDLPVHYVELIFDLKRGIALEAEFEAITSMPEGGIELVLPIQGRVRYRTEHNDDTREFAVMTLAGIHAVLVNTEEELTDREKLECVTNLAMCAWQYMQREEYLQKDEKREVAH